MKLKSKLKNLYIGSKLAFAIFRLIKDNNNIAPIFKVKEFRNHISFKLALAKAKSDPDLAVLFKERYLSEKVADLNELGDFPKGTVGRLFADHMRHFKMDVVFYPKMDDQIDDDLTYLRYRARETHDIHHAILGLNPDHLGEMSISAYYLAQLNIPLSGILLGVGFIVSVIKKPYMIEHLMNSIMKGWMMGKQSKNILAVKWEEIWGMQVRDIRRELNIQVDIETVDQDHQRVIEKIEKEKAIALYA